MSGPTPLLIVSSAAVQLSAQQWSCPAAQVLFAHMFGKLAGHRLRFPRSLQQSQPSFSPLQKDLQA